MARKKKKSRPRDDDDDDLLDDDDLPAAPPRKTGPRNDAYVGMLAISFVCLVATSVMLFLDFGAMDGQQVSPPAVTVPPLGAAAAPAPR